MNIPGIDVGLDDAGRRLSDVVMLHLTVLGKDAWFQWIAANIQDGTTNGDIYPTRPDAVRMNPGEYFCYVTIQPGGWPPSDAAKFLRWNRVLHHNGMGKMPDPNVEVVPPSDAFPGSIR
jgi:hypothetical protein